MSHEDLKKAGMTGGPSSNLIDPDRLFIIGLDGEGETEEQRIEWVKALFPKIAAKIDSFRDPRACVGVPEEKIRTFRMASAKPVIYESMGYNFPDDCGKWSGLKFLAVDSGRQTTKTVRLLNARRAPVAPEPVVVMGKRFQTDKDRLEAGVIENCRIVERTPTQRAWAAQKLIESGTAREDAMVWVEVRTEQGLKNLLDLLDCSASVQAAADAGPDNGGITQSAALDMLRRSKGDHDKQDAELAKRLDAAKGKSGREKSRALAGDDKRPKPVAVKTMARVTAGLAAIDRTEMRDATRVDEWLAIVRWAQGDDAGFDALPDEFRAAVTAAQKRVKAAKEPKPAKRGKRKPVDAPTDTAANDTTITTEREAA